MNKEVVIIGAGGHGKVIADIVEKSGDTVVGFLDDQKDINSIVLGKYKIIGKVAECSNIKNDNSQVFFIIAIGDNYLREKISLNYELPYYTAIHPSTQIGMSVQIGQGTVVMANSTINSDTIINNHCIINTGTIIEHDNKIEEFVHLSPNSTICGNVHVGKYTHVGAGSTIINNISITNNCIIGAGTVVIKDLDESGTYIGIPAKKIK